jgi:hypothetical protein
LEEFDEDLEPKADRIDDYAEQASVCVQLIHEGLLRGHSPIKMILAAGRMYENVPADLLDAVRQQVEKEWEDEDEYE